MFQNAFSIEAFGFPVFRSSVFEKFVSEVLNHFERIVHLQFVDIIFFNALMLMELSTRVFLVTHIAEYLHCRALVS